MVPEHLGRRNSSHLPENFFQGESGANSFNEYKVRIRRFCNNTLSRDVKLWDDDPMWNIDPRIGNSLLRDFMVHFALEKRDFFFQARWWYTFCMFVKRCINNKRNNAVENMKRKIVTQCKLSVMVIVVKCKTF